MFNSLWSNVDRLVGASLPLKVLYLFVTLGLTILPSSVGAQTSACVVARVAILPGSWENSATKISLTAQSQAEDGSLCAADQTIRLSFESSGAGQFTNQAGTSESQAWISTNQANRNFYYESSNLSADSITIRAGYGSADDWTESWSITTAVADLLEENSQSEEEDDQADTDNEDQDSNSGSRSAHSSPARLSTTKEAIKLEVEAGRDRLTLVGSEIRFKAEVTKESGLRGSPSFAWTFGDGQEGKGEEVEHLFLFPGVYQVVLNASAGEVEAVDRLEVLVVEPEVELVWDEETNAISLKNASPYEANVGGWRLEQDDHNFTFPTDTILAPGTDIILDSTIVGWTPVVGEGIKLVSTAGVVGDGESQGIVLSYSDEAEEMLAALDQAKVEVLALLDNYQPVRNIPQALKRTGEVNIAGPSEVDQTEIEQGGPNPDTASTSIIVLSPSPNPLSTILSFPGRSLNWLGNLW